MRPADLPKALRLRAKIADAIGEQEQARLLRGFADTVAKDAKAIDRVRQRIEECAALVDEAEVTPIIQTMRDALADIDAAKGTAPVKAKPQAPALAPAAAKATPAMPRDDDTAILALRQAAVLRADLADLQLAVTAMESRFAARLDALEAAAKDEPIGERLAAQHVPDGRTWLEVATRIASEHGLPVESLTARGKSGPVTKARAHVWWWLWKQAGAKYSLPYIGAVWGFEESTVLYGIRKHEARMAKASQPPSGPRLRAAGEEA